MVLVMRLSKHAAVPPKLLKDGRVKKHKSLNAICEKEFNRNRRVQNRLKVDNGAVGSASAVAELRRSTRARRPPVVLDASPTPAKKRRRIDKNGERLSTPVRRAQESTSKGCSPGSSSGYVVEPDDWRSRLRIKVRNGGVGMEERQSPRRGKRKLFDHFNSDKEGPKLMEREQDENEQNVDGAKSTVVKSRRPGRIKATNVQGNGDMGIKLNTTKENENEKNEPEMARNWDAGHPLVCERLSPGGNDKKLDDVICPSLNLKEVGEFQTAVQPECIDNVNEENVDKDPEHLEGEKEGEERMDGAESVGLIPNQEKDGGSHDGNDSCTVKLPEDDNGSNVRGDIHKFVDKVGKSQIKEGRRCGLCGGGSDGKPPKRLAQDMVGSENEAFSGSSASEEPNYDIWDGFGDEPGWLGRLLGPINDRLGIARIWIHQHCAVWSPEVYFAGLGCLKNARAALCRGRGLKCTRCGRAGATIGCRVDRCPKTYHLPCARANGCHFDHRKFLISCTDHRHLFQPYGNEYMNRKNKLKARKMKLEIRKLSNDAWRKDLEAEEKWLENCGEEEEFLKRESKRLHRDLLRIAPVYIGGSNTESGKLFQGWESVAGLQNVIQCMKEVVILPLLYPAFYDNMGLTAPRGVLLHGHPGTGKTLVVRALIGSCALGDKRIAYFARKGADCLGKYVGDAERQLRLLFQVAERSQPSIIFFDEIDGLAPCRTRQQDQTHNSVVSTLLALMDGLKSRGSVVVIGATNRPEAVDPALRRPGRFDREIYFPLPSVKDRASILSLHTQRWPKPVTGSLLKWVAKKTAGFAGADLQALCTQAATIALKRNFPLQELLAAATVERSPNVKFLPLPSFVVVERDWLEALACAPPPCSRREAGMAANDVVSSPLHAHIFLSLLQPLSCLLVSLYLDERIWLPSPLFKAASMIKRVILTALEKKKVPSYFWWSHVQDLLQEADVVKEIEKELSCMGILKGTDRYSDSDLLNDVDDADCDTGMVFQPSIVHRGVQSSFLGNMSLSSRTKSGFRILIAGSPKSGQKHLASFLLHYLFENVEIRKLDLATISQEGFDMVQGITQILMKCARIGLCVVFMPRVDLWAVERTETDPQPSGVENNSYFAHNQVPAMGYKSCRVPSCSADTEEVDTSPKASILWSSFSAHVESSYETESMIFLATSDIPFSELPLRVARFFKNEALSCSQSNSSREVIPGFIVQVDGKFKHDMVIDLSAAELVKDLLQLFVQLIHYKAHNRESYSEYKLCDSIEGGTNSACLSINSRSSNEPEDRIQCPEVSDMKTPVPPYCKPVKGKSSLLFAVSTFGYQILRYPHFSELCWVTSKLKEGPCTDINGPWKGWPFNTCIIRPNGSLNRVPTLCGSNNDKSREKSGNVRGLIAVALSAYRGAYASPREVSIEVRKVLELLVGQIHGKIQAGKDRCQFIRILSQVAYLEDLVNNWAYTLQSLEQDAQTIVAKSMVEKLGSPDNHHSYLDNLGQSEGSKPGVSIRGPQLPEERMEGLASVSTQHVHADADTADPKFVTCDSEDVSANEESPGESVVKSKDGIGTNELAGPQLSTSKQFPPKLNGFLEADVGTLPVYGNPNTGEHMPNINSSLEKGLSADPRVLCLYCCCAGCLDTLYSLMQKVLIHEWELSGNHWTIDDIHDVVSTLSVNLLSEVREFYFTGNISNFVGEKLRHKTHKDKHEHKAADACGCKHSIDDLAVPMECICHSENKSAPAKSSPSNFQLGLISKFIYRNGLLVSVNPEEDGPFHCKFETLCLCPLIEWIIWTKNPFQ